MRAPLFMGHRGSVAILAAFFLTALIAVGALALEMSHLYIVKLQSQRVADLAAIAAADTKNPIVENNGVYSLSDTAKATAQTFAAVNGFGAPATDYVSVNPIVLSATSLQVQIAQPAPLSIGKFLGVGPTEPVAAYANASTTGGTGGINGGASGCLESSTSYIEIYESGTQVIGPNCTLSANTYVHVSDSASVTAPRIVTGNSTATEQSLVQSTCTPCTVSGGATITDPMANNTGVKSVAAVLKFMASELFYPPGWPTATGTGANTVLGAPLSQSCTSQGQSGCAPLTISPQQPQTLTSFPGGASPSYAIADSGATVPLGNYTNITVGGVGGSFEPFAANYPTGQGTDSPGLLFAGNGSGCDGCTVVSAGNGNCKAGTITTLSGSLTLSGTNVIVLKSGCYEIQGSLIDNSGSTAIEPYWYTSADKLTKVEANITLIVGATLQNSGTGTLAFGDGTYQFNAAVNNMAGGEISFGTGQKLFAGGTITNGGNAGTPSTIKFGDGPIYLNGGSIANNAGGTITAGNATLIDSCVPTASTCTTAPPGPAGFYFWGGSISNASTATMLFGNGPYYFYGGSLSTSGLLEFGNGPYYFEGGTWTSVGQSSTVTVFGTGDTYYYGGTTNFDGAYTTFGCESEEPDTKTYPSGCNDGAITQTGSNAQVETLDGTGTMYMSGGTYNFAPYAGELTAWGQTLALNGGTVNLGAATAAGEFNMTAPTAQNPTKGEQNLLIYIYSGALSVFQTGTPGPIDTVSGTIYDAAASVSFYGTQTMDYRSVPDGCFAVIVGGTLNIYEGTTMYVSPCGTSAVLTQ